MGGSSGSRDHPRVGGEKGFCFGLFLFCKGSPPRGRGKACPAAPRSAWTRITPAWAGKSPTGLVIRWGFWDHPRVGGEKAAIHSSVPAMRGSPPRGRGKGYAGVKGRSPFRITPAWAGKSTGKGQHPERGWDHPRVGGEKMIAHIRANVSLGSPPRGRGKVGHSVTSVISSGITPAWAGKSCGDLDSLHRK